MAEVLDEEGDENEAQSYACVRKRGYTVQAVEGLGAVRGLGLDRRPLYSARYVHRRRTHLHYLLFSCSPIPSPPRNVHFGTHTDTPRHTRRHAAIVALIEDVEEAPTGQGGWGEGRGWKGGRCLCRPRVRMRVPQATYACAWLSACVLVCVRALGDGCLCRRRRPRCVCACDHMRAYAHGAQVRWPSRVPVSTT